MARGTTVVATTSGLVDRQTSPNAFSANRFTFAAVLVEGGCAPFGGGCSPLRIVARLPAGTYTVTLRATDLAGNRSATRTASVVVQ